MAGIHYVAKAAYLLKTYPKLMPWLVATLKFADFPVVKGDDTSELIVFLKWHLERRSEGSGSLIPSKAPTYTMTGCSGCGDVSVDYNSTSPSYVVVPLCNRCYGKPLRAYSHWTISNIKIFKTYGGYLNEDKTV